VSVLQQTDMSIMWANVCVFAEKAYRLQRSRLHHWIPLQVSMLYC